jgi:nitrogenase-stabilizing/protective protein
MADNLREAGMEPDEENARAYFRAHLERAYENFVKSTPIKERVFKVHKDAIRSTATPLVRLSIPGNSPEAL